jgi:protein tyrosine phosphatase (PTP) superfamily phosphohydrolase (DUF442 family)
MQDPSELTTIRPQIAITDRKTARDHESLWASGFRAVLCLDRGEFDSSADPDDSPLVVWLRALGPGELIRENFDEAVDALMALVERHAKVVVHCHHGTGRSVAVVAAYLVRTEALSPEAALDEVAALRGGRSEVSRRLCSMVGLRP